MSVAEHIPVDVYREAKPSFDNSIAGSVTKRLVDIAGSVILLIVALPLFLVIGLIVGFDGGPILYEDMRHGRNHTVFGCLKFRTMQLNAERLLEQHLARDEAARLEWATTCKLQNDPRNTAFGKWLRRYSLDELPQLWNVLKGEMSLVGPRPISILHGEDRRYGRYLASYYSVRPGITGLWQVSGRNLVSYRRRVAMHVYYVRHWSVLMDMLILLRTFKAVLRPEGNF